MKHMILGAASPAAKLAWIQKELPQKGLHPIALDSSSKTHQTVQNGESELTLSIMLLARNSAIAIQHSEEHWQATLSSNNMKIQPITINMRNLLSWQFEHMFS